MSAIDNQMNSVLGNGKRTQHDIGKVSGHVDPNSKDTRFFRYWMNRILEEGIPSIIRSKCTQILGSGVGNYAADTIIDGLDRISYGNSRKGGTRTYYDSSIRYQPSGYYNYSTQQAQIRQSNQPQQIAGDPSPESIDYQDITVMRDRASAMDLLGKMQKAIADYGNVSVAELFSALDIDSDMLPYTYNYYGWRSLGNVQIRRCSIGWWLDLPPATPLRSNN